MAMKPKDASVLQISRTADAVLHIGFLFYSLLCILPVLLVVIVSITDGTALVRDGYSLFPRKISLVAYTTMFSDPEQILRAYGVTLFITFVGTFLSVLVMCLYAYPISRKEFRHRSFFSFYIFIPMLFNGGLVPFYMVYTRLLHLKDSLWALILPSVASAFYILMIRTFFTTTIPNEVLESAKIDGAGEGRVFLRIVLPLSLPVLATVGLFTTLGYWNEWYNSLIFIDSPDKVSIQYLMYNVMLTIQYLKTNTAAASVSNAYSFPSESLRMAMCVVGMGPIILAYPFFQSYFVKGLTIGAVKG